MNIGFFSNPLRAMKWMRFCQPSASTSKRISQ
jgi:hypothetical protein